MATTARLACNAWRAAVVLVRASTTPRLSWPCIAPAHPPTHLRGPLQLLLVEAVAAAEDAHLRHLVGVAQLPRGLRERLALQRRRRLVVKALAYVVCMQASVHAWPCRPCWPRAHAQRAGPPPHTQQHVTRMGKGWVGRRCAKRVCVCGAHSVLIGSCK